MKKIDILFAAIIGEITALYFLNLLQEGGLAGKLGGISSLLWSVLIIFPILSVVCLWIAYLIGKKLLFVFQLAKFLLVGVLATIFDLGSLSIFIGFFGVTSGLSYDVFKGISFIIATIAKYIPDKFWAFKKQETAGIGKEFSQFFIVTLIGFTLNVLIADIIVNRIGPQFGLPPKLLASMGAMGAVVVVFAWNFIGYKFIVFKK